MGKYHFTKKAEEDLSNIWNYTFDNWSESQADKYYAMLLDSCRELAMHPQMGRKYDGVSANLLGSRVGQHIIFYKVLSNKEIEVIRILHVRMDLKQRLSD